MEIHQITDNVKMLHVTLITCLLPLPLFTIVFQIMIRERLKHDNLHVSICYQKVIFDYNPEQKRRKP